MTPEPCSVMYLAAAREPHGAKAPRDRLLEVFVAHLEHGGAQVVGVGYDVEGDIKASAGADHRPGVLLDLMLVEGVQPRRLGLPPCVADPVGYLLQSGKGPTRQVDRRSLAGEGARYGPAYHPAAPIDHGVFVLKQHVRPPGGNDNIVR